MKVAPQKIRELLHRPAAAAGPGDLRREEGVFWVGNALPPRETLETIFESDSMEPAELFFLGFERPEEFQRGEELIRLLKKNFTGFLLGRFHAPPPPSVLDAAYAAGIDLVDIPLAPGGTERNGAVLDALAHARTVFPRWSVLATIPSTDPAEISTATVDRLLSEGILPLATVAGPSERSAEELVHLFQHLARSWRRAGATLRPLRSFLRLTTPLVFPSPRRGLGALLDRVETAKLRTASDLRRLLRVRQVEVSFESAGL